jgi:hypothetical protein
MHEQAYCCRYVEDLFPLALIVTFESGPQTIILGL